MKRDDLPAVGNGNDSGAISSDFEKHGHGEIEMRARGITPTAIVTGLSEVRRTEIGGGDENRRVSGMTPLRVVGTF